jgi:hypothetical protein
MKKLDVAMGDIVEIKGKQTTISLVWPINVTSSGQLSKEDNERIFMDSYIRQNAKIGVGENVKVIRTTAKEASKIVFEPYQPMRFSPEFPELLKKRLAGRALIKGDIVHVPIFVTTCFPLKAVEVEPSGAVIINENTKIAIKEDPSSPPFYEDKLIEVTNLPDDFGIYLKFYENKLIEVTNLPDDFGKYLKTRNLEDFKKVVKCFQFVNKYRKGKKIIYFVSGYFYEESE